MSASEFIEQTDAILKRIGQMVAAKGGAIKQTLSGSALTLEFADGQRILINHDAQSQKIWLAALFAGTEYTFGDGRWTSQQDGSELFTRLDELIAQLIRSNPLNAQKSNASSVNQASPQLAPAAERQQEASGSLFKNLAMIGLLSWLSYAAFQHYSHNALFKNTRLADSEESITDNQCDASFPTNGATHIFPASKIQPNNPADTEISLTNDHSHSFLAIFTAPKSVIPYLSVLVQARQSAKIRLPAGQYDLMLSVGNTWCNFRTGFSDGHSIKLNSSMNVLAEQPMQLNAQSSGSAATDFQLFIRSSPSETPPPPTQFIGDGVMEIRQHRDGRFHIAGSANGIPTIYLIDTGASITSLSAKTANQAGVRNCKTASFTTASGTIKGCIGTIAQLTIGNYQIQNVEVAVMPDMEIDLLGMGTLNHFQVHQANGVMRLSRR